MPLAPSEKKFVVVNSSHPELDQLASELASRGRLRQYFGRYFPDGRWWERALAGNPATRGTFLSGPGRRRLPPELKSASRYQAGVLWDFAAAVPKRLLGRRGELAWRMMLTQRDRAIIRSALRHADPDAPVLANFTIGLEVFERAAARGVMRLLNYPIAHHAYSSKLLWQEAALHPEFAQDLAMQIYHDPQLVERMERECELASRILVGSNFVKQSFVESGVAAEKVLVCPYGVNVQDFVADGPARKDGVFRAIWVGQVTQRKGIKYLLEAWRAVQGPGMELVIAGHFMADPSAFAPYADLYQAAGHLDVQGLRRLYAEADVLVLPSLIEGMGLVVLQAMAAGVPVIVTTHSAGDIVRDGLDGFFVPIRDSAAIAEKLQLLRDNPELRAEMGRNASVRAQAFTWQRFRTEAADLAESLPV